MHIWPWQGGIVYVGNFPCIGQRGGFDDGGKRNDGSDPMKSSSRLYIYIPERSTRRHTCCLLGISHDGNGILVGIECAHELAVQKKKAAHARIPVRRVDSVK